MGHVVFCLMAYKNTRSFVHVFVEVLFPVFISYPNEELSRMFICGISVASTVSEVLVELSARIEMKNGEYE
jgi:hypothetical protein